MITEMYRKLNQNEEIIFPGKKHRLTQPIIQYNFSSRKTIWSNFRLICSEMNRKEKDVANFLKIDLKRDNALGSNGELRIIGRYESMLGNAFDRYVKKYLICKSCGSIKTNFVENYNFGLDYIICLNCPEKKSVG